MNKFEAFTTTIYSQKIEGLDLNTINQGIYKIQMQDSGVKMSNKLGWQSHGLNFPPDQNEGSNNFIEPIVEKIYPYMRQAFYEYGFDKKDFFIHYWLNINGKYSYNKSHSHGDAKMSGVLYTKVPKDSGRIIFERPGYRLHQYDFENPNNFENYFIEPQESLFVIFPAQLIHHVEQNLTNEADDRRISIAFNFR